MDWLELAVNLLLFDGSSKLIDASALSTQAKKVPKRNVVRVAKNVESCCGKMATSSVEFRAQLLSSLSLVISLAGGRR